MKLWQKVAIGIILGLIFGFYLPQHVEIIKPIGTIFMRLIKMVIIPLIFLSLVAGITSMRDLNTFGRIGTKSVCAYLGSTFFAVLLSLGITLFFKPGVGVQMNLAAAKTDSTTATTFNFIDFITNIVPNNIFESFASGNLLQVVFFSIFTGLIINGMGDKAEPLKNLIHSAADMILRMISKIVELSPYAAFSLIAWVAGTQGFSVMVSLSKLAGAITLAMILQYLIFGLFILLFCRMSPIPFYKKSLDYQLIALSTGSSKASLATTMKVCREKLGISEASTSFVLPLGSSINMDGFAIMLGSSALFFAQMLGVHLTFSDYLLVILTATLGSIGGAGIPGAYIIMLPMVLSAIHLPIEGVALLVGLDRLLDSLSTTINITGDATMTLVIDSSEGTLNREIYKA